MKTVKEVIQDYIDGTYEADVEKLKAVFHEKAIMTGYLGDELLIGGPEGFFEDIASQPSMKEQNVEYKAEILALTETGKIADAVVRETGFRGTTAFEDHFHLIFDGEWKIISKTFAVL